ncbi:MAG: hypothetical protein HYU70_00715 [Bacteroidetes bacterium]|nr:hypothetical protein [Bacteroidota bacterium]
MDELPKAKKIIAKDFTISSFRENKLSIEFENSEQIFRVNKLLVNNNINVYYLAQTTENLGDLFIQLARN